MRTISSVTEKKNIGRNLVKYRHCDGKLVLKRTDDQVVITDKPVMLSKHSTKTNSFLRSVIKLRNGDINKHLMLIFWFSSVYLFCREKYVIL